MTRMKGKRILITGASAGIGEACARRFAAEGAELALWARRLPRLTALRGELGEQHGIEIRVDEVDVRDRDAVNAAADRLAAEAWIPHVLINNAGLAAGLALIQEGDPDDWDRMIDTNVKGLLYVTRAILPAMLEAERGHVVIIGSIAGHQVYPMGNVYNASKFAVHAIAQGLNLDLAGTPIRASSIDPGHVRTEFALVRFEGDAERAKAVYEGFDPLGPEDVADAVSYVVNAPPNVNVAEMILLATPQRSVYVVHREQA